MFEFLKSRTWSFASSGAVKAVEPWSLDRNWHRSQAERHLRLRNFAEAQRHLMAAVEEADRSIFGSKQRTRLRLELADTQRRNGELDAAEATARAAIEIAAASSDADAYVNCLDALADIFTDRRDFAALEKIEQDALRLGAALPHPDPLRMAKRVHRLAVARHMNGNSADALPAFEKSIELHEKTYGSDSPEMAVLLNEVGSIYRAQGQHERAQECLRRALRIHEAQHGADSFEALADLQQLAGSLEDAGDIDGAAAQYERCLMLKLRKLGVRNIEEVAVMQFSIANLHAGWGNLARARELLSDCIGSFRHDGGPRLAVAHELLAQVEERSGRYHSAVKELESAGKVWERCGEARREELIRNLRYRADLLDQMRRTRDAANVRERLTSLEPRAHAQTA